MNKKEVMPFHLFEYQGSHYVINIEKMEAHSISTELFPSLERVQEPAKIQIKDHEKASTPITYMYLFLTQFCNLRCIYCYGNGGEYGSGGSMDMATAMKAVDWLIAKSGKMKKLHIGFFGGEPFLNFPLMKAVVDYTRREAEKVDKEVAFFVTTNATLLDDEKISFIKDQRISVQISFDGPKEVQDFQRPFANGQGSYDLTVPKIKQLLTAVPEASGHAVLFGETDPQLVRAALGELGFKHLTLSPASPPLYTGELNLGQESRGNLVQLQALERETMLWSTMISARDEAGLKELKACGSEYSIYGGLVSLLHNKKKTHFCGAGRRMVGVSVTGDIYLCHRFVGKEDYIIGSVFKDELHLDSYLQSPATANSICASCFARNYCAGGCKHDNLTSSGSPEIPSAYFCGLRRAELELASVITANLTIADQEFLVEKRIIAPKPCPLDF